MQAREYELTPAGEDEDQFGPSDGNSEGDTDRADEI
jgi:hypothetical protein